MRVTEFVQGERLVVKTAPDEASPWPGCAPGCLVSVLLPIGAAFAVAAATESPLNTLFLGVWVFVGFTVFLVAALRQTREVEEFRVDRAAGRISWTERGGFGRTVRRRIPIKDIDTLEIKMLKSSGYRREVSFEVKMPEPPMGRLELLVGFIRMGITIVAGFMGLPLPGLSGRDPHRIPSVPLDGLSSRDELRDFGHRLAGVLGLTRWSETQEGLRYSREGKDAVPAAMPPLRSYGEAAMKDPGGLPGWESAPAVADWRERMGVAEHRAGEHLALVSRTRRLSGVIPALVSLALLAGGGYLLGRHDLLPSWLAAAIMVIASTISGLMLTFLTFGVLCDPQRGMIVDGAKGIVEFTGRRAPESIPFAEVSRVIVCASSMDLFLDTSRGAIKVPASSGTEEVPPAELALARALSEILGVPCRAFEPPDRPEV